MTDSLRANLYVGSYKTYQEILFLTVSRLCFFLCVVGDEFLVAKIRESSFQKLLNLDIHKREYPGFVPVFIL